MATATPKPMRFPGTECAHGMKKMLDDIHALLFLNAGPHGDFWDRDKPWSVETVEDIAQVLKEYVPAQGSDDVPVEDLRHRCQDCGVLWAERFLLPVRHLWERTAPGEPMPSGECPACGALTQPVEADG